MRKYVIVGLFLSLVGAIWWVSPSEPHSTSQCVESAACKAVADTAVQEATAALIEERDELRDSLSAAQDELLAVQAQMQQLSQAVIEYKQLKDAELAAVKTKLADFESIPEDALTLREAEQKFLQWVADNPGGVKRVYRQIAAKGADQFCMYASEEPHPTPTQ